MKVLITGGLGFIGMYMAKRLVSLGHEVVTFDPLPGPPAGLEKMFTGTEHFRGDLLSQLSLFEAVSKHKIDRIVHLAALRNLDCQKNPYLAFQLNCEGTINCFEAARVFGLERVVFASTSATVGSYEFYETIGINSLPDDLIHRPINVYGVTKAFDEMMAKEYSNQYGLNIVGVRLALIYGAGKKAGSKTSGWNDLIEQSYHGVPMTVSRLGDLPVSINYAKDSAEASVCAVTAENPPSNTYNCTGHIVTSTEFCDTIKCVLPQANITMINDEQRPNTLGKFETENALKYLNYQPKYSLAEGIEDHIKSVFELK